MSDYPGLCENCLKADLIQGTFTSYDAPRYRKNGFLCPECLVFIDSETYHESG